MAPRPQAEGLFIKNRVREPRWSIPYEPVPTNLLLLFGMVCRRFLDRPEQTGYPTCLPPHRVTVSDGDLTSFLNFQYKAFIDVISGYDRYAPHLGAILDKLVIAIIYSHSLPKG